MGASLSIVLLCACSGSTNVNEQAAMPTEVGGIIESFEMQAADGDEAAREIEIVEVEGDRVVFEYNTGPNCGPELEDLQPASLVATVVENDIVISVGATLECTEDDVPAEEVRVRLAARFSEPIGNRGVAIEVFAGEPPGAGPSARAVYAPDR